MEPHNHKESVPVGSSPMELFVEIKVFLNAALLVPKVLAAATNGGMLPLSTDAVVWARSRNPTLDPMLLSDPAARLDSICDGAVGRLSSKDAR